MRWDLFICHASEDKKDFVEPLARALVEAGYKVWYDDMVLTLGDDIVKRIQEGLANSRYGLVVLSPSFGSKVWPERELNAFMEREPKQGKCILPVWHRLAQEEVLERFPLLAPRLAARSEEGLARVVEKIGQAIGPSSDFGKTSAALAAASEVGPIFAPTLDPPMPVTKGQNGATKGIELEAHYVRADWEHAIQLKEIAWALKGYIGQALDALSPGDRNLIIDEYDLGRFGIDKRKPARAHDHQPLAIRRARWHFQQQLDLLLTAAIQEHHLERTVLVKLREILRNPPPKK